VVELESCFSGNDLKLCTGQS